jgi:hypothetical protein
MKFRVFILVSALLAASPSLAQDKPQRLRGQLDLPEFASLADKASETVNVTLDSSLLGLGCRFLNAEDPEEAAAKKLCTSLRGIYVRHYTFESDFAYPKADIARVVRQLSAPGWSKIVDAHSKKENTTVDVYVLIEGERAQGMSIIATQPREFTIVNIVGSIELDQLHELEGKLSIPELGIESAKKVPEKKKAP